MRFNIWDYYENIIQHKFHNLNEKMKKNIVSFTHTITTILWLSVHHISGVDNLLFTLFMSLGYYIHDLKHHMGNDEMSKIMFYHHVGSCILLPLAYNEEQDLSIAFLLVEISNIPLYLTQIVLHSPHKTYWGPYLKWCILLEFISFLIFRCVGLAILDIYPKNLIVVLLIITLYIASVMWTIKLGKKLLEVFHKIIDFREYIIYRYFLSR